MLHRQISATLTAFSIALGAMCLQAGPAPKPSAAAAKKPGRPPGDVSFFKMYHKTDAEVMRYLKELYPEWIEKGNVRSMDPPTGTLIVVGDQKTKQHIFQVLADFDIAGIEIQARTLKLKHMAPVVALNLIGIAGICNVWFEVDETRTQQWKVGKKTVTFKTVAPAYTQWTPAMEQKPGGEKLPFMYLPAIPYVVEMPTFDPFVPPTIKGYDMTAARQPTVQFNATSSTEERNRIMVVGTEEDYQRVKAFLDTVDRPAKQIMLEVQIVELTADALRDLGLDAIRYQKKHSVINFNTALPGEPLPQVGFPEALIRRHPEQVVQATMEGFQYLIDDSSVDLAGKIAASIRILERRGEARVKARPKLLTLDDRQNILHIGKEVPTFESTAVQRDTQEGHLVSTVQHVAKQYVGITLNFRPRITGEKEDEVVIQMDIAVNELGERQRVFAEDLLGVPTVAVRRFTGQARVKNHVPIILGGLIKEQEVESTNQIPILGDIPIIGQIFGRKLSEKSRTEIIMIITPHILADLDPAAMPRESIHFDTEDSILFNDRYLLRGSDLIGVDHATGEPINTGQEVFTRDEVVELTLLHIVKKRRLVGKLRVLDTYLSDEASKLWWWQRKWPDETVRNWTREQQEVYYKAAAYVIETIKNLNLDLDYEELLKPRREIVLPTSPHRVSLTYDKVKILYERGYIALRGNYLDDETYELLKRASTRTFYQFARFIERTGIPPKDHGEFRAELLRLYREAFPEAEDVSGLEYPDFLRELAKRGINFTTVYTYFKENEQRYKELGVRPDLGALKFTLKKFLEASVPISEKAKELMELDERWQRYQQMD